MRLRCPACHAEASLEAWSEDEAARDLVAFLSVLPDDLGRPLLSYVGLWRPARRALSFERALRIAREALALHRDEAVMAAALSETVDALRAKRDAGDIRPLESHGYLKRVVESVAARAAAGERPVSVSQRAGRRSATLEALERLQKLKEPDAGAPEE